MFNKHGFSFVSFLQTITWDAKVMTIHDHIYQVSKNDLFDFESIKTYIYVLTRQGLYGSKLVGYVKFCLSNF